MLESGIRMVGIPAEDKARAVARPVYLRAECKFSSRGCHNRRKRAYEGAVSATITVNFRFRDAAFKKASTVLD